MTLNASGQATFSTGILPTGTDTIKAVYGGDANYFWNADGRHAKWRQPDGKMEM